MHNQSTKSKHTLFLRGLMIAGAILIILFNFPQLSKANEIQQEPPATSTETEELPISETGVKMENGTYRYYENGVFKSVTGVFPCISDGRLLYVENGVFKAATGVYPCIPDGRLLYIEKGVFKAVTGIVKRASDIKWVYVQKGVFKKKTGVAKRLKDKKQLYVRKGVFKKKTGLAQKISNNKWVFVKNGKVENRPSKIYLTKSDRKAGRAEILAAVYAKAVYKQVTNSKMTRKQKLKACFMHAGSAQNYAYRLTRIPHYNGTDWPAVYANDMIKNHASVCFGYAAMFGYLAKACGYENVYCCTNYSHAWVEINGRVYDPAYLDSTWHTMIFGATYKKAKSLRLGASYNLKGKNKKKWMYVKLPMIE